MSSITQSYNQTTVVMRSALGTHILTKTDRIQTLTLTVVKIHVLKNKVGYVYIVIITKNPNQSSY